MPALQNCDLLSRDTHAMDQLHDFLRQRREAHEPVADLDAFAQELHRLFVAAEREAFGQELARCDVDVPVIDVDGQRYRRVLRCEQTYSSAAGPVRVERTLYRQRQGVVYLHRTENCVARKRGKILDIIGDSV
jgi:hypothetical protein